jgi:hypothetical protein
MTEVLAVVLGFLKVRQAVSGYGILPANKAVRTVCERLLY